MTAATVERPARSTPRPAPSLQPHPPQRVSELRLAALVTAVGCARRFARHTLRSWRLDGLDELGDSVDLVTSELVTNAVRATGITEEHPRYVDLYDQPPNVVIVRLRLLAASLFVEVWDADPTPPTSREPTLHEEGGRGLFLVAAVSKAWNFYPSRAGGKVVWAELAIPALETTQELPPPVLPRRSPAARQVRPVEVTDDLSTLQRVLHGLRRLDDGRARSR